jgi:hypothetical protein
MKGDVMTQGTLVTILCVLVTVMMVPQANAADFYVVPDGNDTNPGTQEKPVKTLSAARDVVRLWKKNAHAGEPVTVWIKGGRYQVTETFSLDERDSGTADAPVIYRAVKGEQVRIVGSVQIAADQAKIVSDPAILQRMRPEVRGKVVEVDLKQLGVTDYGSIGPRGFSWPYISAPLELFIDSKPMPLSRWPKAGQPPIKIGKVLDKGSAPRRGDMSNRGATFTYATDGPSRWSAATDVWISGIFDVGWADATLKVAKLDIEKRTLSTLQPHFYGFSSGQPWNSWYALNLLEEITQPGEYSVDRTTGKLYFLPPDSFAKSDIEVSTLSEPLVAMEGASFIHFESMTFECSRGIGVYIERGESNTIAGCTLRNLGIVGVCIGQGIEPSDQPVLEMTGKPVNRAIGSLYQHLYANTTTNRQAGRNHLIQSCEIYNIGAGGVSLGGGDRKTLDAGNNAVVNCDIHDFNRWDRTYRPGVNIDGVGSRIANCHIHDCPGSAILLHGNEHIIELNEIDHAVLDTNDMGAFYMGRDPSERGTVLRNNYWHDIGFSPVAHQSHAIYLDDQGADDTTICGNVFQRTGKLSAIMLGGGSYQTVENNIFINCPAAVYQGKGPARDQLHLAPNGLFETRCKAVNFQQPPWSTRYPEFTTYLDDRSGTPTHNTFLHNLIVDCKQQCIGYPKPLAMSDNKAIPADPAFTDPAKLSATIQLNSEIEKQLPGFAPIPWSRIGIQHDQSP